MSKIDTSKMDNKMKERLMQSESGMGRAYRDQLLNNIFGEPEEKKEREVVQVYKDELDEIKRIGKYAIEESNVLHELYLKATDFIDEHNLWNEFENYLLNHGEEKGEEIK